MGRGGFGEKGRGGRISGEMGREGEWLERGWGEGIGVGGRGEEEGSGFVGNLRCKTAPQCCLCE